MFKTYDDVISFNQANMDAMMKSGTTFVAGIEEITKEAFGFAGKSLEKAMDSVKVITTVKTPAEAVQIQQTLAKEAWDTALAETNRLAEMTTVVSKTALEPIQARYKVAFETFKAAA